MGGVEEDVSADAEVSGVEDDGWGEGEGVVPVGGAEVGGVVEEGACEVATGGELDGVGVVSEVSEEGEDLVEVGFAGGVEGEAELEVCGMGESGDGGDAGCVAEGWFGG